MNEHADAAGYPSIDLDAVIADGDRRVRRRRIAVTGGAAAVVAVVVTAVAIGPSALDLDSGRTPPVGQPHSAGPFAEQRPTYAVGSTIHYGADVVRADGQVRSFVQTDDGFVYSTPEGRVMFTDGQETDQIGTTNSQGSQLAADIAGSDVGWTDPSGGGAPAFVVYDTATGTEVVRTADGSLPGSAQSDIATMSAMIAVDDGVAYWHDGAGVQAYDLASGTKTLVQAGADANWLDDVQGGVLAHTSDLRYRGDAGDQRIVVNADPDATAPGFARWSHGYLPPDARHVAVFGGDRSAVLDVATGADVTPPHPAYGLVYFGQWIDDDAFTFLGFPGRTPSGQTVDLLRCSIAEQTCAVAATDISGAGHDPVILPGMPLG
jgi:hypothetical protein